MRKGSNVTKRALSSAVNQNMIGLAEVYKIQEQMDLINKKSMVYYDGIPRNLLNKSDQNTKDRLNFAKQKWFTKHGIHLVHIDQGTQEQAR